MAKVTKLFTTMPDGTKKATRVGFKCPGCGEWHWLGVQECNDGQAIWGFNGNFDKPTFTPSILATTGHYLSGWRGPDCYCNWNERYPDDPIDWKCNRCHSFVTDGRIQFLADCTHALAGHNIELPEIEEEP